MHTREQGQHFERLASEFLRKQGLVQIQSNYQARVGEIDLVMRDQETLVFVEVRYREKPGFGSPLETITPAKQKKIRTTAKLFLCEHGLYDKVDCRFDAIGITMMDGKPCYEWVANAFS